VTKINKVLHRKTHFSKINLKSFKLILNSITERQLCPDFSTKFY